MPSPPARRYLPILISVYASRHRSFLRCRRQNVTVELDSGWWHMRVPPGCWTTAPSAPATPAPQEIDGRFISRICVSPPFSTEVRSLSVIACAPVWGHAPKRRQCCPHRDIICFIVSTHRKVVDDHTDAPGDDGPLAAIRAGQTVQLSRETVIGCAQPKPDG